MHYSTRARALTLKRTGSSVALATRFMLADWFGVGVAGIATASLGAHEAYRVGFLGDLVRSWNNQRLHTLMNRITFNQSGHLSQVTQATIGAATDKNFINFNIRNFCISFKTHIFK